MLYDSRFVSSRAAKIYSEQKQTKVTKGAAILQIQTVLPKPRDEMSSFVVFVAFCSRFWLRRKAALGTPMAVTS